MKRQFSFNSSKATDQEIYEYIDTRENIFIISFVSPKTGIPHMCPVWGIFLNGSFFFQTDDHTVKVKYIKQGYEKIGISIVDPALFPDYKQNSIPYLSFGGSALIRLKSEFPEFVPILNEIFVKYIPDEQERKKVLEEVLTLRKNRVLIEVIPEWVKITRVP